LLTKKDKIKIIPAVLLLAAYAEGNFPMADSQTGEINWYSPELRAIIPLNFFKISRSLNQTIKKNIFEIRLNTDFEKVMRCCAARDETWISEEIIQSYIELNQLGYAHSVEAWHKDKIVGGLYGVAFGGAFFGESMFSIEKDASKVALVFLVNRLKEKRFTLLDTQYITPHLKTFGAIEIPRSDYIKILKSSLKLKSKFI
jgi:leucyl/phenylalanyl-tRNA---protein transferase